MLSVVIMAKNEEKYIGEVFDSLKSIKDHIDTEVILLDTGSSDNTINIAKSYNVNVYFENWNDDFSDMRNKSISYAKNEWILILDADEVVVDSSKLIEFFKSGKHKKYNSGVINIININSINNNKKDIKSSCNMLRLFRNGTIKFHGIIHEQPMHKTPTYQENLLVCEHYGYMFEYEENIQKKNNRNLKLLKKQLEIEKNNPYVYFQLARTYLSLSNYKDANYYINICKNLYNDISKSYYIYQTYINIKYNLREYTSALKLCKEYVNFDNFNIDIFYILGVVSYELKNYEEVITYLDRYLYLFDNYELTSQYKDILLPFDTNLSNNNAKILILKSYFKLEKYDLFLDLFNKFNGVQRDLFYEFIISNYKANTIQKVFTYYEKIMDSNTKKILIESLEKCILHNIDTSTCEKIYELFSKTIDDYSILNKYRIDRLYNNEIEKILKSCNLSYIKEIIYLYIKTEKNLPNIFFDYDREEIRIILEYITNTYKETKLILYDYLVNIENTSDLNKLLVYKTISSVLLNLKGLEDKKYLDLFYLDIMYNYIYINTLISENIAKDYLKYILSDKEKFVLEIVNILPNKLELIKCLKEEVQQNKNYLKIIEHIILILEKENGYSYELNELKSNFIRIISNDLNKNNLDKIENLIDQYEEIFGQDSFSLNTKGIIYLFKADYKESEIYLKKSLTLDIKNLDILYNIAYLKECQNEYKEAINFYKICYNLSSDLEFKDICSNNIALLADNNIK